MFFILPSTVSSPVFIPAVLVTSLPSSKVYTVNSLIDIVSSNNVPSGIPTSLVLHLKSSSLTYVSKSQWSPAIMKTHKVHVFPTSPKDDEYIVFSTVSTPVYVPISDLSDISSSSY